MAEKPILMSGPMVRAIYAKLKTVTRRPLNPQPPPGRKSLDQNELGDWCWDPSPDSLSERNEWRTPRYQLGDVAWVKESYRARPGLDHLKPSEIADAAGDRSIRMEASDIQDCGEWGKLRPSLFMCRWMSRLRLNILGARPEILGDITEEDAIAEGVRAISVADIPRQAAMSERQDFSRIWDSIHGPGAWERDCRKWIWRYEFEVSS